LYNYHLAQDRTVIHYLFDKNAKQKAICKRKAISF
jgi:hypothetical protein